jgi:hypothetical protein
VMYALVRQRPFCRASGRTYAPVDEGRASLENSSKSMTYVKPGSLFMLRVLRFVPVISQGFPKPTGSSTRYGRDMEGKKFPPR